MLLKRLTIFIILLHICLCPCRAHAEIFDEDGHPMGGDESNTEQLSKKKKHLNNDYEFEEEGDDEDGEKREKKKSFRGFGAFSKGLRDLCVVLEQDGRRDVVYRLLLPNDIRDESCSICKPLFHTFSGACKPRESVNKKAKGELMKSSVKRQREPSPVAINLVSEVFSGIAENEVFADEILLAVERLLKVLRDPTNRSPGERDYLEVLTEYMAAPFQKRLAKLEKVRLEEAKAKNRHPDVNSLFH